MASPLTCDLDLDHGEASFLVTNLDSQDAKAFCTACFARTALAIAKAVLPPDELAAQLAPAPAPAAANGEETPRARGGRKRAGPAPKRGRPSAPLAGVATPPPADQDG